jgi:hypothetical protein
MGLKKYFSERHGYKAPKVDLQLEEMDDDLRVAIWNTMCLTFWDDKAPGYIVSEKDQLGAMLIALWIFYFKRPLDELPHYWQQWEPFLKEYIFSCEWHEVYEILEFMFDFWPDTYHQAEMKFIPAFNNTLERELSGYRVINGVITPIINEMEIAEIEESLNTTLNKAVHIQLEGALRKLSDRKNPDYRGSIKDSISAVETLCRIITGEPKLELGKALKLLEQKGGFSIHAALREGFSKLYGWTSDDQGIRHALMDEPNLTFHDAKYMLVSCSAFINYLVAKSA